MQSIQRWNKNTDIPLERRADKVLRSLGWELQPDFEHLTEEMLASPSYLENIIDILNNKAGIREDDEKRRAFKSAVTENGRRKDESLAQYAMRRLRDFNHASTFGVVIPDEFRATMLKEGAGLSEQNMQNLSSMVQGREHCPEVVARALARLDVRSDRMTGYVDDGVYVTIRDSKDVEVHAEETSRDTQSSDEESQSLDEESLYKELEALDLTEDQAVQVFAVLESRPKRRTWKQNKEYKADLKKNRQSFTKGETGMPGASSSSSTSHGKSRRSMNRDELKKVTRCRRCGQKGHWEEDCKSPPKGGAKKGGAVAFSYCSSWHCAGPSAGSFISVTSLRNLVQSIQAPSESVWNFLSLPSGVAIVDTGATQDLIGEHALKSFETALASFNLRVLRVAGPVNTPSGIGGTAVAKGIALVPLFLGGAPGVLEMTVLEGSVPPLLSVGFLDFLGATLDLPQNLLHLKQFDQTISMNRLPSGHRTIELFQWPADVELQTPPQLKKKYQLGDRDFHLDSQALSAYTKGGCRLPGVLHEPNLELEHETKVTFHEGALDHHEHVCSLQLSGSASMGLAASRALQAQFVPSPRCADHELSTEPRGEGEQLGSSDADLRSSDCSDPGRVPAAHPGRGPAQEPGIESHEVHPGWGSRAGALPASASIILEQEQSVCFVDDLSSLRSKGALRVQEGAAQEQEPCGRSHEDGNAIGPDGEHFSSGLSSGRAGGVGSQPAEPASRAGLDRHQPEPSGAGARSEPDDDVHGFRDPGAERRADGRGDLGAGAAVRATESQLPGRRLRWPAWMMASALSSWVACWDQCSPEFQAQLLCQGLQPSCFVLQYKLESDQAEMWDVQGGLCQAVAALGNVEDAPRDCEAWACRPLAEPPQWLPSFSQARGRRVQPGTTVLRPGDEMWTALWFQVRDVGTGMILENRPLGSLASSDLHLHLDAEAEVLVWGLPQTLLSSLSWADDSSPIVQLDADGRPSPSGCFWAFQSELLESSRGEEGLQELPNQGHDSEQRRCQRNLIWLARRATQQTSSSSLDFQELFSPPRVRHYAQRLGLRVDSSVSFDLQDGWDVRSSADRSLFRKHQRSNQPLMLMASPDCGAFTQLRHLNRERMKPEAISKRISEGLLMWNFSLEAIHSQIAAGHYFGLEHPAGAASWKLPQAQELMNRLDTALITFDMCAFGLQVTDEGLSQKPTKILTNNPWLAASLAEAQCSRSHVHVQLMSGLPKKAQVYPAQLCQTIAQSALAAATSSATPSFLALGLQETVLATELLSFFDEHDEEVPRPQPQQSSYQLELTSSQKRLVKKVHENTGHPDRARMLRAFRAAGALPQVLKYIRDEFKCEDCALKHGPDNRRRAQFPRTFAFNKILSVDFLYVSFHGLQVPILNMVDVGTSYQVAVRVDVREGGRGGTPPSALTWKAFSQSWMRYCGAPQMILCDSGNEFKSLFERQLELAGIYQHVTIPECP